MTDDTDTDRHDQHKMSSIHTNHARVTRQIKQAVTRNRHSFTHLMNCPIRCEVARRRWSLPSSCQHPQVARSPTPPHTRCAELPVIVRRKEEQPSRADMKRSQRLQEEPYLLGRNPFSSLPFPRDHICGIALERATQRGEQHIVDGDSSSCIPTCSPAGGTE